MSNKARPILVSLTGEDIATLKARLDGLIDRSGGPDACWPYSPPKAGSYANGYPVIYTTTSAKTRRLVKIHRLVFELETGESPPSVDHLCHDSDLCRLDVACPHRRCCNPAHLGASTVGRNASRAQRGVYRHEDHCGAGLHPRNDDNTYEAPNGDLRCRPCDAERARNAHAEVRAQMPPRERKRRYRPRGMSKEQLVDWALGGRSGDECMTWPDTHPGSDGYARVSYLGHPRGVHVLVFEVKHGPIPTGHVVDHTCHDPETCEGGLTCPHRACINPAHLAVRTREGNSVAGRSSRRRPTHCPQGHEYTPENTYTDKRGSRHCRACAAARALKAHHESRRGVADGRLRRDGKCRNGHDVAEVGVRPNGTCTGCARKRSQEYKERQRAAA